MGKCGFADGNCSGHGKENVEINSYIYEFIRTYVPEEDILLNEPMYKHTTFRVGGEAMCFLKIGTAGQLKKLIPYFKKVEIPYFILGNGSNLLVGDRGYRGIVLQIGNKMNALRAEGERIRVQAGATLAATAKYALEKGLSGLEFASGIPGTIGGGVVMNAGAYGGEIQQVAALVTVLNPEGEILELDRECMEFGYRTSVIKNRPFIVLEVALDLVPEDKDAIRKKMEELAGKRKEKQPLEFPSAGSTFKRPEGYFAGKLIMDAGMRGYRVGGAQVSEKHCGFVVNTGNATAADIARVIKDVKERVKEKFKVTLETEVIFLGDF